MSPETMWVGYVLAALAGALLAGLVLWLAFRSLRSADESRAALADATRPLSDSLERISSQMREFEAQRQHMLGGLENHLSSLSRETVSLSQALRGTNSRGRWGELTLKRVAELAGMAPHCDFYEQANSDTSSGNARRPDMIVRLAGGRMLPVDAKAPLSGYLDAEAAPDGAGRVSGLDKHAQQLWRHVAELSSREYWGQFDAAPEMVVLFLPGEHFLSAALERRPDLLDAALARKVLIATPVTLVSVLKGIAFGWKQERLAKNAEELRRIAGEFHERIRTFGEYYTESGRNLQRAVEAYNKSVASWEARLAPSLKRMRELGVGVESADPVRIDAAVRVPRLDDHAPRHDHAPRRDSAASDHPIV